MQFPALIPVATPDPETIPIDVLLLTQTPPEGKELNVVVKPSHTISVPLMTPGSGFTVIVIVVKHPLDNV